MSSDHVLPAGARRATHEEAIKTFKAVRRVVRESNYTVGLTGSTLIGDGMDIDFIIASAFDSLTPAYSVANELIWKFANRVLEYEELDEHAQSIALAYVQNDKTVVDILIVGLPE